MEWLSLLTVAVAPGLALLTYFYLKDRYVTEPIRAVASVFLLGMLVVFPIMIIQRGFILAFGENEWLFSFVISAGIEEFFKWFIVYFFVFPSASFDEPYDGIVYAVASSIGFATVENLLHVLLNPYDLSSVIIRALLPVSAHALFGVVMGYFIGKAKFSETRKKLLLLASLAVPIFWHGWFDWILLTMTTSWYVWMAILMAVLWGVAIWKMNRALAVSPFRSLHREEEVNIFMNGQ
ncbi:glutamic-type intramembrane protease PrsW [Paenibacillus turpanensis]|uniref:glutamic-type intramembrane protease PrsW n=1 Tax=Paenibacillus turpanensis TaxID=2689078 RepID=UPI00140BC084|nr:glutamic-type intramembrane protease PrsW [Paenibacillus turpanensis]